MSPKRHRGSYAFSEPSRYTHRTEAQPGRPLWIPGTRGFGKCRHPAVGMALLVSPHGALGATEANRDLLLRDLAAVGQKHHRIRFGYRILLAVVVHRQSSHDHHPLLTFRAQQAAGIDGDRP
jgi:hypothetical protein